MTTARTGGASRAPSARPPSTARDILRKRGKPYKTEQSRILAKKRKPQFQTTHKHAPEGFAFVALGTPDLATRCKELSRQKGFPILVVSANPVHKHAADPEKVSSHVHRIGYHFRSDVIEDACQELGYTVHRDRFVKEAELEDIGWRSRMARTLERHGLRSDHLEGETDDQIRSAIKELFPKIPEADLKEILRHAWAEGSKRVGNSNLGLPRRVQLAVIARIRHAYTDYDRLLRAFTWKEARLQVEPDCLRKLIEWRGENDLEDDGEMEEVIRETIVIDDDDDDDDSDGGADAISIDDDPETIVIDDDSEPEQRGSRGTGYNSDTSVEITHRLAADEDLSAESHDERSNRFLERYQLRPRDTHQRDLDVLQQIGAMRQQLRNEGTPMAQPEIVRVHVPESSDGIVEIGGQQYRRVPSAMPQPIPGHFQQQQPLPSSSSLAGTPDRPVPSIEPHDDLRRIAMASAATRSHPATPETEYSEKRRRIDYPPQGQSPVGRRHGPVTPSQEVSVERPPYGHAGPSWLDARHDQSPRNHSRAAAHEMQTITGRLSAQSQAPSPAAYDPNRPLLRPEDYREHGRGSAAPSETRPARDYRPGFVDAQVAPIQYVPHPKQLQVQPVQSPYARPLHPGSQHQQGRHAQQQVIYVQTPRTPLPVHGEPAAVQQVPRPQPPGPPLIPPPGTQGSFYQPATPHAQYPQPYPGAPAQPPQYWYPR